MLVLPESGYHTWKFCLSHAWPNMDRVWQSVSFRKSSYRNDWRTSLFVLSRLVQALLYYTLFVPVRQGCLNTIQVAIDQGRRRNFKQQSGNDTSTKIIRKVTSTMRTDEKRTNHVRMFTQPFHIHEATTLYCLLSLCCPTIVTLLSVYHHSIVRLLSF